MATDLQSLLMNLNGLDDARVERLGRAEFRRLYVPNGGRGTLRACDGSEVVFFEDRFDHAFFTTTDRYRRPYAKNIVSRDRIARVAWIGPVLRGEAANTQCWETCRGAGDTRIQRLCVASAELYVVWLEARRDGGWRFTTAYVARAAQTSGYAQGKRIVWRV